MPRAYSNERRAELTAITRARILGAVRDLVIEVAPDSVTIPIVAERADVALRTVYNHFPSRAALLSAALIDLAQQVGRESLSGWDGDRDHPRDALRRYLGNVYIVYGRLAPWFDALLSVRGDPELDQTVVALRAGGRAHVATLLGTAADQGLLRVPLEAAITIVSVHTLYPVWHYVTGELGHDPAVATARVAEYLDTILFGAPDDRSLD